METPNKPAQPVCASSAENEQFSGNLISSRRNERDSLYAAQLKLAGDSKALKHIQALQVQSVIRQKAYTALNLFEKSTSANSFAEAPISFRKWIGDVQKRDPASINLLKRLTEVKKPRPMVPNESRVLPHRNDAKTIRQPEASRFHLADGNGLIFRENRVYVPPDEALRTETLKQFYDFPGAGYWGVAKTLDFIQRFFYCDGIKGDIAVYVASYPQCQRKAIHRYKPYGKLKPLPPPKDGQPIKEISLNWVTGLPASRTPGG